MKNEDLEMAEYLLPFNNLLTIEEKCKMFEVKNSLTKIPLYFSSYRDKSKVNFFETT